MKALRSVIGSMSYDLNKNNRYNRYNTIEGLYEQAYNQIPTKQNTVFVSYKKDWQCTFKGVSANSFDLVEVEIPLEDFSHLGIST